MTDVLHGTDDGIVPPGHFDTLESLPHRRAVQRVRYRDLDVAGPGPAGELPRVARHAADGMARGEQFGDQPPADVPECPGDKTAQPRWSGLARR